MKLSKQHVDLIFEKLNHFPQAAPCPVCQTTEWSISDTVIDLTETPGVTFYRKSGMTYPAVPICCRTCGNMLLLNAIILGIIDPKTGKPIAIPAGEVAGG